MLRDKTLQCIIKVILKLLKSSLKAINIKLSCILYNKIAKSFDKLAKVHKTNR